MKQYFIFLFTIFLYNSCKGQIITATIDLAQDQFEVQKKELGIGQSSVLALNAQLGQDEILITYRLPRTKNDQFYLVTFEASLNDSPLLIRPEYITTTIGEQILVSDRSDEKSIVWNHLINEYINLKGTLIIKLNIRLEKDYECPAVPPTFFTWQDQKQQVILGSIGLGSILAGQIFRIRRDNFYKDYENQETIDAAQPYYEDANRNHHTYLILTYTGSAILVGDLIWEYIRFSKFKGNQKDYERYCLGAKPLTIRPAVLPIGNSNGVGLVIKYKF